MPFIIKETGLAKSPVTPKVRHPERDFLREG